MIFTQYSLKHTKEGKVMAQNKNENCPKCDHKGQAVDNATIKSLINVSLHRVNDVKHRFCADADCDIAYFAEDGSGKSVV